jgi:hypothetical protein
MKILTGASIAGDVDVTTGFYKVAGTNLNYSHVGAVPQNIFDTGHICIGIANGLAGTISPPGQGGYQLQSTGGGVLMQWARAESVTALPLLSTSTGSIAILSHFLTVGSSVYTDISLGMTCGLDGAEFVFSLAGSSSMETQISGTRLGSLDAFAITGPFQLGGWCHNATGIVKIVSYCENTNPSSVLFNITVRPVTSGNNIIVHKGSIVKVKQLAG